VSAKEVTRFVRIDSALVVEEILVYVETRFHGAIRHDFRLDSAPSGRYGIGAGDDAFVLEPVDGRAVTSVGAFGGVDKVQAGLLGRRARWDRVGVALCRHKTDLLGVSPCSVGVTSLASIIIRIARNHILKRQLGVVVLVNAKPIGDRLHCSESPARSTFSLVLDGANGGAVGPLSSGVKGGGDGHGGVGSTKREPHSAILLPTQQPLDILLALPCRPVSDNHHSQ